VYVPRFWSLSADSVNAGAWTSGTWQKKDGARAALFTAAAGGCLAGQDPEISQTYLVQRGVERSQLALVYVVDGYCYPESGVSANIRCHVRVDANWRDGTTTANKGRGPDFGDLVDSSWNHLHGVIELSDIFSDAELPLLESFTIRIVLHVHTTVAAGLRVALDSMVLLANCVFGEWPAFPVKRQHGTETKHERAKDSRRSYLSRTIAGGLSKSSGTIPFGLISQEFKNLLEGIYAYRLPYLRWFTCQADFPTFLDIVWTGDFAFAPTSPNLAATFAGSIPWQEY
jgi:hypothetical protein